MAVKGISKQVIVVQSPEIQLFEQAIFILKDDAAAVSEDKLLQEANRLLQHPKKNRKGRYTLQEFFLLGIGASLMGFVWLLTAFF